MAGFKTMAACLTDASTKRTALEDSVVKLYQSTLTPDPSTTVTELDAAECDYGGYAAATITAWGAPILAPGDGYAIYSPQIQFDSVAGTENLVGGAWIEDDAGNVRAVIPFPEPIPMGAAGQGFPISFVDYFRTGYVA